jgi:predicted oxidoreductase
MKIISLDEKVALALKELQQSGKVRFFGVSNFTPSQVDLLQSRLDVPLVTNQIEVNVLHLDPLHDGTLDQCQVGLSYYYEISL